MKIVAEVTNKEMTLKTDETPPGKFILPRDRFLAAYNAMLRAKELKDGEIHLVELRPQDEILTPEQKKQKKGMSETFKEIQKIARDVGEGMRGVGKEVMGGK